MLSKIFLRPGALTHTHTQSPHTQKNQNKYMPTDTHKHKSMKNSHTHADSTLAVQSASVCAWRQRERERVREVVECCTVSRNCIGIKKKSNFICVCVCVWVLSLNLFLLVPLPGIEKEHKTCRFHMLSCYGCACVSGVNDPKPSDVSIFACILQCLRPPTVGWPWNVFLPRSPSAATL